MTEAVALTTLACCTDDLCVDRGPRAGGDHPQLCSLQDKARSAAGDSSARPVPGLPDTDVSANSRIPRRWAVVIDLHHWDSACWAEMGTLGAMWMPAAVRISCASASFRIAPGGNARGIASWAMRSSSSSESRSGKQPVGQAYASGRSLVRG